MDTESLCITVVLFEGFELLDVFGPVQLLRAVPEVLVVFAGLDGEPVASSQGVEVVPTMSYVQIEPTDALLIPGGKGPRQLVGDESFLWWLREVGCTSTLGCLRVRGFCGLGGGGTLGRLRRNKQQACVCVGEFLWGVRDLAAAGEVGARP